MLIETMTPQEITGEIYSDWSVMANSLSRLGSNYHRDRRKFKVNKEATYSRVYELKSKRNNSWLFILSKAPSIDRYKDESSLNICSLTFYYTSKGLRVFKIIPEGGLSVFNAHLFHRYQQRTGLEYNSLLDIVKHFFKTNGYFTAQMIEREGKELTITVCREGLLLGELQEGRRWIVHRTFINRELSNPAQDEVEADLINSLQDSIQSLINEPYFNRDEYNYRADISKGINPPLP